MLLDIENKVIIFDEGHNMEDSAREAASLSVTTVQLTDVSKEIDKIKGLCKFLWYYFIYVATVPLNTIT